MRSLYAEFVKELMNWDTLEDKDSFVSYELQSILDVKCLKIIEMYVKPEARGRDKWRDLTEKIEQIAKNNECSTLSATISKSTSDFTQQRTAHLCRLYGMEKSYEDMYSIIYSKKLS